jgi:hypothetical protein
MESYRPNEVLDSILKLFHSDNNMGFPEKNTQICNELTMFLKLEKLKQISPGDLT